MAGDSYPTQSRPAKSPIASKPTYIDCIDEDILREIFIRLPSSRRSSAPPAPAARGAARWPPPLPSAADSARSTGRRSSASSSRPLQPPKHLTFPPSPAFFPTRRRDRDLAAAVRCGDFFLTFIQERPDESLCWDIIDSRHGYVLLMNWDDALLTVFNPLLRWSKTFDLGPTDLFDGSKGAYAQLNARLIYSDENPMSFRVIMLANDTSRVRAAVLTSETWEWSLLPWVDVLGRPTKHKRLWIQNDCGMQANGFLYWVYTNQKFMITLDTKTMEFSVAVLPQCLKNPRCHFVVGETKYSTPCIVYATDFTIGVLLFEKEGGGAGSWNLEKVSNLYTRFTEVLEVPPEEVNVVAVMDGFAYLAAHIDDNNPQSRWHLSLCLETMELDKLFRAAFDESVHPYVMAWPSALVGNYGTFALGEAP